ncbi:MAG: hypothetical protein RL514_3195 [Verrucomicrobiota bacterium]|jgi:outer membrane protein assembly factor BamB
MHFPKLLLGLTAALACVAFTASAADWPQWRGPLRNGHVAAGEKLLTSLPTEPKVLWRAKAGEGFASPVVAGGQVFVLDNQGGKETLRAFDAANGTERWRAEVDDAVGDKQGPPGPRCTPLVDGDRIYAQSCKGELQCRSVADGKLVWRKNYVKDFEAVFIGETGQAQGATRHGNTGSPLIEGDWLIALAGGTNGAGVVALEKRTGQTVWKSQSDQAAYAAPTVAVLGGVKQVIAFTCDGLLGLDFQTGKLLWRVPLKTQFSRHVTTPVVVDDLVVVASHTLGLIGTKVTQAGGTFTATQAWVSKDAAINYSSPVVVGKHLYCVGPNKNLICVDVPTGQLAWSQDGVFTSDKNKAVGYFLVLGANILASTDSGQLVLFAADPKAFREVGRAQVCASTWSGPAYVAGKLFHRDGVKTGGELLCLDLLGK